MHVYIPLTVMRLNMYRYAKYAVVGLIITGISISLPTPISHSVIVDERGQWRVKFNGRDADEFDTTMRRVDTVLFAIIPLSIIIPINTTTVVLLALRRQRKVSENSSKKSDGSTRMLVSVVVVYSILKIPRASDYFNSSIGRPLPQWVSKYLDDLGIICSTGNNAVNFVIYFVVGPSFRKKIKAIFCHRSQVRQTSVKTNERTC